MKERVLQLNAKPVFFSKKVIGKQKLRSKKSCSRLIGGAGGIISPTRRRQIKKDVVIVAEEVNECWSGAENFTIVNVSVPVCQNVVGFLHQHPVPVEAVRFGYHKKTYPAQNVFLSVQKIQMVPAC